ncbi:ATP/GTP-binding protein [Streptomyces kronopolitis]|uniref:ATP/GTP-binding protein n=1 Tax=Streptomyces kronopolitis TaxID=1612435 RepID=A0ABQ2K156_9ACTN|nr:hypothetical protein [Streptomyces kronopolitis]GGN61950.1 ATP/GTP-binding protein [Streptomyces kronopolitis]
MLTRRRMRMLTVLAAATAAALLTPAPLAAADGDGDGSVSCPPDRLDCDLTAKDPAPAPAGKAGVHPGKQPGRVPGCAIDGKAVPCHRDGMGTFNSADACYWAPMKPQPAKDDPVWKIANGIPDDFKPGDTGALYEVSCPGAGRELMGGVTFAAAPPSAKGPDLQALARKAISKMRLDGPDIASPRPTGRYVVGMPMWMWARKGPATYGPATTTATAGAVTVTATATVSQVRWDMGDGSTVTCSGAGTPYRPEFGKQRSPDCGHLYRHPSNDQPTHRYRVRATATWTVHWTGAGQAGDLTTTRASTVTTAVGEAQVLN